ncbi:MAG TPA: hypothetical protein VF499_12495 [Afipia sp.]
MRLLAAPHLARDRVVVVKGGEIIAAANLNALIVIREALKVADEVYLHPDTAEEFKALLIEDQKRKRRLN